MASYTELAAQYLCLKEDKANFKKKLAEIEKAFDTLTKETIPDKMAEDGFRSVNLADGGRIQLSRQAYCSTRAGMKVPLFDWLRAHEFEDLITEVVNPSTLKAFIKEQAEAGNEIPDDEIVNYEPYTRATIVGG